MEPVLIRRRRSSRNPFRNSYTIVVSLEQTCGQFTPFPSASKFLINLGGHPEQHLGEVVRGEPLESVKEKMKRVVRLIRHDLVRNGTPSF